MAISSVLSSRVVASIHVPISMTPPNIDGREKVRSTKGKLGLGSAACEARIDGSRSSSQGQLFAGTLSIASRPESVLSLRCLFIIHTNDQHHLMQKVGGSVSLHTFLQSPPPPRPTSVGLGCPPTFVHCIECKAC